MAELDVILGVVTDIKQQLDEVDGKCDKLDGKCDELLEFKAVHLKAHETLDGRVAGMKKTLYGNDNGTGLTYKVEKLLQCKQNLSSSMESWRRFWIGVLKTLLTAAIIAVTAWLLSVYRAGPVTRPAQGEISSQRASEGP